MAIAALAAQLGPMLANSAASGGGGTAATPDSIKVDTGDITPTLGGSTFVLGGSGGNWMVYLALGFLALLLLRRRK